MAIFPTNIIVTLKMLLNTADTSISPKITKFPSNYQNSNFISKQLNTISMNTRISIGQHKYDFIYLCVNNER